MQQDKLPQFLYKLIPLFVLFASPSFTFGQGDVFSDCESWEAAVCVSPRDSDFAALKDADGQPVEAGDNIFLTPIPNNQELEWGTVSQTGNDDDVIFFGNATRTPAVGFGVGIPITFTPNTAVLGTLQGVCFPLSTGGPPGSEIVFSVFEGNTVVETHTIASTNEDGRTESLEFGWINNDNIDVSKFEFSLNGELGTVGFVINGQLAFGDCEPQEQTCFEQLGDVKAEVQALLDQSTGHDAAYLAAAEDCITWMQNDDFWEQPSGNRLSVYGGSMFIGAAYTVAYLEWVDDPQADVIIDQLLDVLECIVDNEIAYAIANGGKQCFIERAEDFAELGDIIDEDFDNEFVATLAYRLAWLNAYYSTY
jgi:hypothetical protein